MSDRVADALERIATALELIAGDMTGDGVAGVATDPLETRCEHGFVIADAWPCAQCAKGDSGVRCGACGSPMVRRHRKRDGNPFFGCSLYPECTETIDIGDPSGDRDDELPDYPPDDDSPF